jgi:hypothetical protein
MGTPLTPGQVGPLEQLNSFVNASPTIEARAGAEIDEPAHKAVMFDSDGNVVIATSGDKAIGTILSSSPDPIHAGEPVHILIKYIGLAVAGAAIAKGDLVTVNATGQVITADEGDFIFGRAFTAATAAGQAVQVQINGMGYIPVPEE